MIFGRMAFIRGTNRPGKTGRVRTWQHREGRKHRTREQQTMTAARAGNPVTEGVRSLEVRWIFAGQADTTVAGWFARFPAGVESREDAYLVNPRLRGLSVKIRGHGALEVKVYRGSPGILGIAGRARGRMEFWQKWSFPCGPASQGGGAPPGWVLVHKRISRIWLASGQIQARALGQGEERGCMVELTDVLRHGEAWWTLGFEATGPASLLRRELEAAATLVAAHALPDGVKLDTDHSQSYAAWLGREPGTEPPLILNPCQAVTDEPPDRPGDPA